MGLGNRGPPSPTRSEEAGFGIALSRIYEGHQLYASRGTSPPMVRGFTRGILLRRGDRLIPVGRVLQCASPWGQRRRRRSSVSGRGSGSIVSIVSSLSGRGRGSIVSIVSSRHSIAFVCVHRVVCRHVVCRRVSLVCLWCSGCGLLDRTFRAVALRCTSHLSCSGPLVIK